MHNSCIWDPSISLSVTICAFLFLHAPVDIPYGFCVLVCALVTVPSVGREHGECSWKVGGYEFRVFGSDQIDQGIVDRLG
jgi:hypothetical protein